MNSKKTLIYLILTFSIIWHSSCRPATIYKPVWRNQGDGARVYRIIGNDFVKRLDPFLMLDYFHVKLPAGFPDHPHRGFQTITYMKSGVMHHQDFKGHRGTIQAGDIQWMTAGKGIVHAQMPGSFEQTSVGFQLWLNLKSQQKMKEPNYQQFKSGQIQTLNVNGSTIKVICGNIDGKYGLVKRQNPIHFFDVQIQENGYFQIVTEKQWLSLVFVYDGDLTYQGPEKVYQINNLYACVLQKSYTQSTKHIFKAKYKTRFLFMSALPLKEPVASHGPIVMNTQSQLKKAFSDIKNEVNGFEGAQSWSSKIKEMKIKENENNQL